MRAAVWQTPLQPTGTVPGMEWSVDVDDGTDRTTWRLGDLTAHADLDPDGGAALGRRGATVPVRAVLITSHPWVTVASADGAYRASIPAEELMRGGMLLVGSVEAPLEEAEGGPVRLLVTDGDTLCWNVKHVGSLTATEERLPDSVPEQPPH